MNKERWEKLSFADKIGNIGSEVARAKSRSDCDDQASLIQCLYRCLELIDLTLDTELKRSRLKEICRLREVIADWCAGTNVYHVSRENIINYCIRFKQFNVNT